MLIQMMTQISTQYVIGLLFNCTTILAAVGFKHPLGKCVCACINVFLSVGKCMLTVSAEIFCVYLGLFVQTIPSQLNGNRASHVQRERETRSPTERYDSLRFSCCLLFCVGGAVNYDSSFD